ncbi:MAG: GerMN domain-containing protein [Cyanobacteria bacterium SBLK]|nr:GerMN domain-containing protein [Cyanobacteria bacterium SBLK]
MPNRQHDKINFPLKAIAIALILGAIAAGCQKEESSVTSAPDPASTPSENVRPEAPSSSENPPKTEETPKSVGTNASTSERTETPKNQVVEIYWLDAEGNDISLVASSASIEVKADNPPEEILETALEQLLAGPASDRHATTIPEDTQLRNVVYKGDGIHVNLSEEFTFGGGTASMTGRVAQILYTATSIDPNGKVWLEIEGEPLEVLGGEGILLDLPLTRQSFEADFNL